MSENLAKDRARSIIDLLFHALRVNDQAINEHAAAIFRQLGPEVARRLVLEAASKKNSLRHRLRVLAVIEQIEQLSGPDDWLILSAIGADKNPQIRDAVARCLLVRHMTAAARSGAGE